MLQYLAIQALFRFRSGVGQLGDALGVRMGCIFLLVCVFFFVLWTVHWVVNETA